MITRNMGTYDYAVHIPEKSTATNVGGKVKNSYGAGLKDNFKLRQLEIVLEACSIRIMQLHSLWKPYYSRSVLIFLMKFGKKGN